MRVIFTALVAAAALALSACHSDPYPSQGQLMQQKPPEQPPSFGIEVQDVINIQEGQAAEIPIIGHVPSGKPEITLENAPQGAKYLADKQILAWTPDFSAANDPKDPTVIERLYPVTIDLRDGADSVSMIQHTVTIVVKDTPQAFTMSGLAANDQLTEGQQYTQDIKIQDGDFPTGPFLIQTSSAPAGVSLAQDASAPTLIHLSFTPGFNFVLASDSGNKNVQWNLTVIDPRGHRLVQPVDWNVADSRQPPQVFVPQKIDQGPPEVDFAVNASDPNQEIAPTLTADQPDVGKVTIQSDGVSGVSQAFSVKWSGLDPSLKGQTKTLTLHACVNDDSGSQSNCTDMSVPVLLNGGA